VRGARDDARMTERDDAALRIELALAAAVLALAAGRIALALVRRLPR